MGESMLRITVLLSLLLLASCTLNNPGEKPKQETEESPVISSLQDSSLPCFKCHAFERFSGDAAGEFSHLKHLGFGVHCNQCHIIKPHKEMALNENTCNNCHHLTTFTFSNTPMPVTFSHQKHAGRFGCGECHPKLFQMKRGASHITMDEMYHGNSCGKCHDGKTAFSSKECAKCHALTALKKDFSYPSGDMTPAIFSHQLHMSMFACNNCHTAIFKYKKGASGMKMDDIYKNKFCGSCHNGQTAFASSECQRCHK
jgi:c(7)-type cytochrome triheme protein